MTRSRHTLAVPFALLASLTLLVAAITPALAAPAGSRGSAPAPAEHVECNVTFDAEGNLLLEGVALTDAQAAVLELALADADLAAALELAAQADADACLNLVIDTAGDPVSATLNGHIDICGTVAFTGQGIAINDVVFEANLNNELGAFLDATVGIELCASVTVVDNAVSIDVSLETCATVMLTADDTVVFTFSNDTDFALPVASVTGAVELEEGLEVFLAVMLSGSLDLATDAVTLEAELLGTEGCEVVEPGTLTIVKETSPAGSTETFAFRAVVATSGGGVGDGSFELGDGESNTSDALGTHTVTEMLTAAQLAAGWTLADVTCDDAGATISDGSVQVVIEAGDDVTCVFENLLAAPTDGTGATAAPTPGVSLLPDTTVSDGGSPAGGLAPLLALVALASLGMFGYVSIVRRERG